MCMYGFCPGVFGKIELAVKDWVRLVVSNEKEVMGLRNTEFGD